MMELDASKQLWGEIDDLQHAAEPTPAIAVKPASRVVCHVPTLDLPHRDTSTNEKQKSSTAASGGCNIILHSLQLQRYVADMRQIIAEAHSKMDMSQFGDVELPQAIKMPTRYNKGNHPKPYKLESCGPQKRLRLQEVGLSPASLHAMLRKGVATVCVLVGYEKSNSRALDVLCSVLSEFLKKFCTLLRFNSDHKEMLPDGQDAIECSLLDCGIAGREAIHQYWQKEVCDKAQQLTNKADALEWEYNQLLDPSLGEEKMKPAETIFPPLSIISTITDDPIQQLHEEETSLDSIEALPLVTIEVPSTPFKSPEFGAFSQFSEHMSDSDMNIVMKGVTFLPKKRSFSSTSL